jgi:hypothetical protein
LTNRMLGSPAQGTVEQHKETDLMTANHIESPD